MLYAAYGSNMNVAHMAQRCPKAIAVGTGYIRDYLLEFRTHATIVRHPGRRVPVVMWEITQECEAALDRYEGYPAYYRKEVLPVTSVTWLGKTKEMGGAKVPVDAMVYFMNAGQLARPAEFHRDVIAEGYSCFGINQRYLKVAIRRSNIV
jgi:hypothetical protein